VVVVVETVGPVSVVVVVVEGAVVVEVVVVVEVEVVRVVEGGREVVEPPAVAKANSRTPE